MTEVEPYIPGQESWESLKTSADEVLGHELIKDETADRLIGVPFIITRVVFREGVQRKGAKWRDDFVSCEAVVAPENILTDKAKRGKLINPATGERVAVDELPVEPDEHIIFNDGSTGIYRQIMMYLSQKGLIILPDKLPEMGGKGESRYDLPRSEWAEGSQNGTNGIPVRLYAPRGLRYSEYQNDYTEDGKTRYIG